MSIDGVSRETGPHLFVYAGLTRKAWPLTKVCLEQVGISIVV